jgi:hypothetical protein
MPITKSRKSSKSCAASYSYELKVHPQLAKSFFNTTYLQSVAKGFKKKMQFTLDEGGDIDKMYIFRATGTHRNTIKSFGIIVDKHYYKMVRVSNDIVTELKSG